MTNLLSLLKTSQLICQPTNAAALPAAKTPGPAPVPTATCPCCSFITPPGQGFLPRETALHHQEWAVKLVQQALAEAGVTPSQIGCIAFTKVPTGNGWSRLQSCTWVIAACQPGSGPAAACGWHPPARPLRPAPLPRRAPAWEARSPPAPWWPAC